MADTVFEADLQVPANTPVGSVYFTYLFSGYVGAWPYLIISADLAAGGDTARITINYYSDSTFNQLVGFKYVIRQGGAFSSTQYANLSEWCKIYYETKSGNPMTFTVLGIYGASSPANQMQLVSLDVPIYQLDQSVAAATSVTATPIHVQPGPGVLAVFTNAAVWFLTLAYFDYGANAFLRVLQIDNTVAAKGGVFQIAMLDTPMQIVIHNTDASAETFRVSLMSTL